LACPSCRRFVRETSARCPFCGDAVAHARAPLGGFLGVVLGVSLVACGGSGDDDAGSSAETGSGGSMTAPGSSDGGDTDSATGMGSDTVSTTATTGPLYGPITGFDSSDGSTGGESDSGGGSGSGSDGDSTGATDTGDSTAGSDSVGPLYGPVTGAQ
jgi:hypothetical protein